MPNQEEKPQIRLDRAARLLASLSSEALAKHDQEAWIQGDSEHPCQTAACIAGHCLILEGEFEHHIGNLEPKEMPRQKGVPFIAYRWLVDDPSNVLSESSTYREFHDILHTYHNLKALRDLYSWITRYTTEEEYTQILNKRDEYLTTSQLEQISTILSTKTEPITA